MTWYRYTFRLRYDVDVVATSPLAAKEMLDRMTVEDLAMEYAEPELVSEEVADGND